VGRTCHTYVEEKYIQKWMEESKKETLEDLGVDGRIIQELLLKKQDGRLSTGFICIRMGASGGPL
jgi:hypothetical protein